MNKEKILEEAIQELKNPGANSLGLSKGNGMAIASLAIAVGDLNEKIKKYSDSSDNYARAMKWLTVGIFVVSAVVGTFEIINLLYRIGIL